jgi:hypothetical protein
MKQILISILFCFYSYSIRAQIALADNEKYCTQYRDIIAFIAKDSLASKLFDNISLKFKINNTVNYGVGGQVMISDYLKGILNIDKIIPGDSAVKVLWANTFNEEIEFNKLSIHSKCLEGIIPYEQNPNIEIEFSRKSDTIVFVEASIIKQKPSYGKGMMYLFFFSNDDQIKRVFKKDFIE